MEKAYNSALFLKEPRFERTQAGKEYIWSPHVSVLDSSLQIVCSWHREYLRWCSKPLLGLLPGSLVISPSWGVHIILPFPFIIRPPCSLVVVFSEIGISKPTLFWMFLPSEWNLMLTVVFLQCVNLLRVNWIPKLFFPVSSREIFEGVWRLEAKQQPFCGSHRVLAAVSSCPGAVGGASSFFSFPDSWAKYKSLAP